MTIEQKKDWLNSYNSVVRQIEGLLDEAWWILLLTANTSSDVMGITQKSVDNLRDIGRVIEAKLEGLKDKRKAIEKAIDSVKDERYKELLRCKHIYGMTYEEVSKKMSYERRYIMRLHERALNELDIAEEM